MDPRDPYASNGAHALTDQTLPLCGDSGENPIAVLEAILTASLARYNRYNQTSARHTASAPPPPGPFVDIGCGRGKFVASACLLPGFSAAFSECKGIEIMPERVKQASQFLKAVETHPLLSQWLWRKRSSAAGAGSLAVGGGGRVRAMMTVGVCERACASVWCSAVMQAIARAGWCRLRYVVTQVVQGDMTDAMQAAVLMRTAPRLVYVYNLLMGHRLTGVLLKVRMNGWMDR